jgi:hypothetical protein
MQSLQVLSIIILALQSSISAFAFNISPVATVLSSTTTHDDASTSRRSLLNHLALTSLVAGGLCSSSQVANASGGATAGGAYLLSAKQRYNERVKTSVQGLLTVGESLKGGSTNEAKAYFSSDEAGSWKDLTAAGYLLSNAFRRSSTTAPDSLPAVKVRLIRPFKQTNKQRSLLFNVPSTFSTTILCNNNIEIQGICKGS